MFSQYQALKAQYRDCILMFRMGDFYEMFGEDARAAAKILEITLTARGSTHEGKIPMCGVPHHSVEPYIARLLKNGLKVAVADQLEESSKAKGLLARDVVRVITPGTNLDLISLEPEKNNYLVSVAPSQDCFGISMLDLSTGDFSAGEIPRSNGGAELLRELERIEPSELVLASAPDEALTALIEKKYPAVKLTRLEPVFDFPYHRDALCRQFGVSSLHGFGLEELPRAVVAASHLLEYVRDNLKAEPAHLRGISVYNPARVMLLDAVTRRNLELTATLRTGEKRGSLFWVLDQTSTPMGKRLLRRWIEQPLVETDAIHRRLEAVRELTRDRPARERLAEILSGITDLERLSSRVATRLVTPKELLAVRDSLRAVPELKKDIGAATCEMLSRIRDELDPLDDVRELLEKSISDDAPRQATEGGIILRGYHKEVDELRDVKAGGRNWLTELEEKERETTGIKKLKIGFNKVFGYYIEVTKPNLALVPDHYIRKQTTVNGERFFTPELKEKELAILGAEERLKDLEYELFCEIRDRVSAEIHRVLTTARAVAALDVLLAFADTAVRRRYVCPVITDSDTIKLTAARHPVLELMLPAQTFIPNDTALDCSESQIHIITGPNMAGKSTYMRQVALVVIMAQIGSFVPCDAAEIGIADRIFTRVGAVDDITLGLSTFMVEMVETAVILHNATRRSLVLLDEVGRGTGTSDGIAIAWAVTEWLHERIGARTLFATHFLELIRMAARFKRIKNFHVTAHERGRDIVFTHKLRSGSASRSFGVEVARLAGLPPAVVDNAAGILDSRGRDKSFPNPPSQSVKQLSLIPEIVSSQVEDRLREIKPDELTPRKALDVLFELKELLDKKET